MAAPVQSGGYIYNHTVKKELIVNGGVDAERINNNSVLTVCREGCNYSSIQSAIIDAIPWSIIEVECGDYNECINISKPLYFKSIGGRVNYLGTVMPYHYPVTFSQENYFKFVDLNFAFWHINCTNCTSYEKFCSCYKDIIQTDPSNALIYRDYAVDQSNIWQKYDDALANADKALQIDPRYSEVWTFKATILNKIGKYPDAMTFCERAIELDPFDYSAWTEKGYALGQMKKYEDSLTCIDRALAINPNLTTALQSKAYLLCLLSRFDESIPIYENVIRINPDNVDSWNNLGYSLDELGRYNEALEAYDEAIRLDPDYKNAWNNKGHTLKTLGRIAEANAAFAKAKKLG
jgi:tetratricopeptide (TPR) repeat protein